MGEGVGGIFRIRLRNYLFLEVLGPGRLLFDHQVIRTGDISRIRFAERNADGLIFKSYAILVCGFGLNRCAAAELRYVVKL